MSGIPLSRVPKALQFVCCGNKRIVDSCQLEVHLLFSERTIWLSTDIKREFKRGEDTPIGTVDTILLCSVSCLRFVLLSYVSQ